MVLTTVNSLSNDVYEVGFGDGVAPLRGTGSHPLYSLDRDDWVRVRDLQIGERLQTAEGAVSVEALEKVRGLHRVFNLEVEGAHEYFAGEAGVRAHNNCLKPEHLGLSGRGIKELSGELFDSGTTRIMNVNMLQADKVGLSLVELRNAVPNMLNNAREAGMKILQINATFANDVLQKAVMRQVKKFGGKISTVDGVDTITFLLD